MRNTINRGQKPSPRPIIALVEDDEDQRQSMEEYLALKGYRTWSTATAENFYRQVLVQAADIVLLDIGLPGENGLSLAQHVIDTGMGIIIVSARSQVKDRIEGLHTGADTYLVKPVDMDELTACIESLWRRMGLNAKLAKVEGWLLNRTHRSLTAPNGVHTKLTPNEFALLGQLVDDGWSISRTEVAAVLAQSPEVYSFHRIDVLLNRLRQKVKKQTGLPLPLISAAAQRLELTEAVHWQ